MSGLRNAKLKRLVPLNSASRLVKNPKKFVKTEVKELKKDHKGVFKDMKGTRDYFKKPKFPEQIPAEMADEEMVARANNRDMIRRRRSGGRSSTIMSDTLG